MIDHACIRSLLGASVVSILAAASAAVASPVSGTFVGATADEVELVQIIQTPDGKIAGRIDDVSLSPSGDIQELASNLEGAADGRQVVLSVRSLLTPGSSPSLTGFIDGAQLDVSWIGGGHRVLQRADAYQFEAAVTGLRARSLQIKADRAAAEAAHQRQQAIASLLASAQAVRDHLQQVDSIVGPTKDKLVDAEDRYRTLGPTIGRKRHQSAALGSATGFSNASAEKDNEANGFSNDLEATHGEVTALAGSVRADLVQTRGALSSLELACGNVGAADERTRTACADLATEKATFSDAAADLEGAFEQAEHAYRVAVANANDSRGFLGRMLHPVQ